MLLGDLYALVEGEGPPVVLLHGNSEDGHVFDLMRPYLAGFTTITLDSRGHGVTPMGSAPMTLTQLAIDTCGALRAYRKLFRYDGQFGLIGFSDGANIGLELAIHRPELLGAQVLIGGNTTPGALKPMTNASILVAYWAMRVAGLVSAAARRRAKVFGLMVGQPNVTNAQLAAVKVPTLVMVGERDVVARWESQRTARLIPGASWVEIKGYNHYLPRRAPRLVGELSADYLRPRLAGQPAD
ncbi:MAG: alpha/beta hydrolase [Bifidobacteriaceae bacterium]|nr:alpha/beta hydrolase [Bifidobacteriaceae bacterium]